MGLNDSAQHASASAAMYSPTPGKVQKYGRKQSNLQAAPGNIVKALNAMPGPSNMKSENEMPARNTDQSTLMSQELSDSVPQPTSQSFGCCSQKPQAPTPAPSRGFSCGNPCAPSTDTAVPDTQKRAAHTPSWDDMPFTQTSAPQLSYWQNSSAPAQGQLMQPYEMHGPQFQPTSYIDSYTQDVSSSTPLAYSGQMNGLGISQSMTQFASDHTHNPSYVASKTFGDDLDRECNCGDDCQCLGCASHPFNNTTLQHVQEMGVMMTFDGDQTPDPMASAYQSSPSQGSTSAPMNFSFMHSAPSLDHGVHNNSLDAYADPNSNLPSGYSSPLPTGHPLNQQLMHTSEYYTIEYPVGLPGTCSDVTGSCQCGSDCSCVGCLTHRGHNGVPAPIPESSITEYPEQHPSYAQPSPTSSPSRTSHIPVLDNVSMPCMSPRTLETSMI